MKADEAVVSDFVNIVLSKIVYWAQCGDNPLEVEMERERRIAGEYKKGRVEYVISKNLRCMVVTEVIYCKFVRDVNLQELAASLSLSLCWSWCSALI